MLRLSIKSKLSPEEVIKRAVKFFGPAGYGLTVREETGNGVALEGGGGGVEVTAFAEGKKTNVELSSREWDYQAKEFIRKVR
jgi:hypothetical protein